MDRIKSEILSHYTIYPNFANTLSDRLVPIELFDSNSETLGQGHCSIILGTVFDVAFKEHVGKEITGRLASFMATLDGDVFYLPHPRDQYVISGKHRVIGIERIAEEIIADMLNDYAGIDLYGFCSSAQINLASNSSVNNFFFSTSVEKESIKEMRTFCSQVGLTPVDVIDIDAY